MRGVILAGGTGSRLHPLTTVTNKHLLPVGPVPMIEHPIRTLRNAGITDVMIVTGVEHAGQIVNYCGSGEGHGMRFNYAFQERAGGIAQALGLCESWAGGCALMVVLGDNIFDYVLGMDALNKHEIESNKGKAAIFFARVPDPERFGCIEWEGPLDAPVPRRIIEKPKMPPSHDAVTGCYLLPPDVFGVIRSLKPSGRGELEITDVVNHYLEEGLLIAEGVCDFWSDAGTPESYQRANEWAWKNWRKK